MSSNESSLSQPPPPPPGIALNPTEKQFSQRKQLNLTECKWASAYPEIQKACYLARVSPYISPKSCRYKNIQPILQEGPTCGLVALSMLVNGAPNASDLLNLAREKLYTKNGEMFSALNLFELVKSAISDDIGTNLKLFEGKLNCHEIKQVLQSGGCLLVPYDPDFNHGPCVLNGRKAHWALIIGHLIDDNNKFYVFSRHGKTRNIAIWSLKLLSESNANLNEFEQPKGYPDAEFLLPMGGIGGVLGLKNKCIIVNNVPIDEVVIK
ncbi:hypothetical protein HA402_010625 [Bradysia odoriphaga]|nr:hypothetical protein HA402_010625 [Bradysia odoriphaga]